MTAASIPEEFAPLKITNGFIGHLGPIYCKRAADNAWTLGLMSSVKHGNPNGVIHGAVFVALVDTCMGHVVEHSTGRTCATVSFDTQFIAGGKIGSWIEARARMRKVTKTLAFLEGEVSGSGEMLMTASAIFRVFDRSATQGRV